MPAALKERWARDCQDWRHEWPPTGLERRIGTPVSSIYLKPDVLHKDIIVNYNCFLSAQAVLDHLDDELPTTREEVLDECDVFAPSIAAKITREKLPFAAAAALLAKEREKQWIIQQTAQPRPKRRR